MVNLTVLDLGVVMEIVMVLCWEVDLVIGMVLQMVRLMVCA